MINEVWNILRCCTWIELQKVKIITRSIIWIKRKFGEFSSTKRYSYLNKINVADCLNHFKLLKGEKLKTKVKWVILMSLNETILNYWVVCIIDTNFSFFCSFTDYEKVSFLAFSRKFPKNFHIGWLVHLIERLISYL